MRKIRRKWLSVVLTLAMLVGLMIPFAGPAAAAGSMTALQVPNVSDDGWYTLGKVLFEIPAGALKAGDSVILRLPEDFKFTNNVTSPTISESASSESVVFSVYTSIDIPATYGTETNNLYNSNSNATYLQAELLADNELKLTVTNDYQDRGFKNVFYLTLNSIYVDEGFSGDIELTAEAPSGSGFPSGTVVVGRVPGGNVEVSVSDVKTFSDSQIVKIKVKENKAGALDTGSSSLKFILPDGFEWDQLTSSEIAGYNTAVVANYLYGRLIWGNGPSFSGGSVDGEELRIGVNTKSTAASYWEFIAKIRVSDESRANTGDVVMRIEGDSDHSPSELVVAKYGEYGVSISIKSKEKIYSGSFEDQDIGDIVIKENIKGSLVAGRSIILTLPAKAKWGKVDTYAEDSGVALRFAGFPGKDGRSAKWIVEGGPSTGAAELTLEDMEIITEPGFSGDLTVEVSGTAGLSGQLVVAEVVPIVTASASAKPVVTIGMANQPAGDLIIKELVAGAIQEDKDLILDLGPGVAFSATPKVEVIEGDLKIDTQGIVRQTDGTTENNQVKIPIDRSSNVPSTIKVSGILYTVDRTVPAGDIKVNVKGSAVTNVNVSSDITSYFGSGNISGTTVKIGGYDAFDLVDGKVFPATSTAASAVNATVGTPAAETKQTASFTIGSTTYTINGVQATMDVAPYTKDGRTYLPMRYVAYALGISPDNVIWDGVKATFIGRSRVVQVTPGSNVLTINGDTITMDVPAELVGGRTMVPFRWVAQAFGAQVDWDEATQTVNMTL